MAKKNPNHSGAILALSILVILPIVIVVATAVYGSQKAKDMPVEQEKKFSLFDD